MKQKTITTDKATLLVVELPNGKYVRCHKGYIIQSCSTELDLLNKCKRIDNGDTKGFIHIGNWQLLGRLSDITEEQAEDIVDSEDFKHYSGEYFHMFVDYNNCENAFDDVLDSLHSLLQANEVYFENRLGEEPDISASSYTDMFTIAKQSRKHLQWELEQAKVWGKERTFLFIKSD